MSQATTIERLLAPAFGLPGQLPTVATIWHGHDGDAWRVMLESGYSFDASVWTTREGIEALRDACNVALVEADAQPTLEVVA